MSGKTTSTRRSAVERLRAVKDALAERLVECLEALRADAGERLLCLNGREPRACAADADRDRLEAVGVHRGHHALRRDDGDFVLDGATAEEDTDLRAPARHSNSPTSATSVSSSMLKRSRTRCCASSISATTSAAVASPRFRMKLRACRRTGRRRCGGRAGRPRRRTTRPGSAAGS